MKRCLRYRDMIDELNIMEKTTSFMEKPLRYRGAISGKK